MSASDKEDPPEMEMSLEAMPTEVLIASGNRLTAVCDFLREAYNHFVQDLEKISAILNERASNDHKNN